MQTTMEPNTTVQDLFNHAFATQIIPYRIAVTGRHGLIAISNTEGSLKGIPEDVRKKQVRLAYVIEGKYVDPFYEPLKDSEELFWEICTKED